MYHRARCIVSALTLGTSLLCTAQTMSFGSAANPDSVMGQPGIQPLGPPSITGVVVGADGSPLHDIRVEAHSTSSGMEIASCYTSSNGSFEMAGLRSGNYELVAVDGLNEGRERVVVNGTTTSVRLRVSKASEGPKSGTVSVARLKAPDKVRELTAKAHDALVKNHVGEAQKQIERALAIAPDYPDALTMRAVVEISANQPDSAMNDLDHAVKSDPTYGPAYLVLGAVFNQMGRSDEALRSLDRAAAYDPKSWQCAFEMSKAWLAKHDYEHALQQLSRAQTLGGPKVAAPIHLLRGYALMGEKHLEQAASELEAYLTADPNGQLAGTVRAALAKLHTTMAENSSNAISLPAVTGLFAAAH